MKGLRVLLATRLSARGLAREIAMRFLVLASPLTPNPLSHRRGGFERCSKKKKGVVPFEGHPRLSLVFRIRLPRHCASTRELNSRDTGFLSSVLLRRTFHHPPHPDVRPGRRSLPAALPDTSLPGGSPHLRAWPPTFRSPSPPCGGSGSHLSSHTHPKMRALSWRPFRDIPVLATAVRIALRLRPTAPLVTARVPLREATAVFGPASCLAFCVPGLPAPLLARPLSGAMGLASVSSDGCPPVRFSLA